MDGVIASDIIKSNTRAYAKYILTSLFPNVIDGFKKVKRRIIYTQPLESNFGGLALISNAIKIHPFGDQSLYDAATRLTCSFHNTFPLIHVIGNGGSYGGGRAASARYTEFKLTDFCKDILFYGINFKTIPMEPTEDLKDYEIKYFIPKIPTALLYDNESIGFGDSSRTVPLKFENICDLTIDFVSCPDKLNWNYSRLAKLFVPYFPIQIYLKNSAELISAYSKGKFNHPIDTEGIYFIKANNVVLIRTLAYGISPEAIRDNLTSALKDKNHWLSKLEVSFEALSEDDNYIDFQLTAKRGTNIFDMIERLKSLLRIRAPFYVINKFVFDDKLFTLNPPEVIQMWYKERYRSIFGFKKHRQQELQLSHMKLSTYLVICEHVTEVVNIIRQEKATIDDVINNLKARFELSTRQCNLLINSNLQILMRSKRDELEEKLAKVNEEFSAINESFKTIDQEICTEIKALKKKYKSPNVFVSKEIDYIGCLLVGDLGIVQITNEDAIVDTAKLFTDTKCQFIPYHNGVKSIRFAKYKNQFNHVAELPATINASGIIIQYKSKSYVFIRVNGRSQCLPDSTVLIANNAIINNVSPKPLVVMSDGSIKEAPQILFDTRKSAASVLFAFDKIDGIDKYVVISVNAAHPNVIRFQAINITEKAAFSVAGETAVISVIPFGIDAIVANLPEFHKHSICYITDIMKYVGKGILNDVNLRMINKY